MYTKVLIARHSPENKCFADEGEWLIIGQKEHRMKATLPKEHHFFVGINSHKPARYGWVKTIGTKIDEFDLASKVDPNPSPELLASCLQLLEAVSGQNEGTPMACTFSDIIDSSCKRTRVLRIHRVILYNK